MGRNPYIFVPGLAFSFCLYLSVTSFFGRSFC